MAAALQQCDTPLLPAHRRLQTLQTVAFLSSYAMLHPEERFLIVVPKVGGPACTLSLWSCGVLSPPVTVLCCVETRWSRVEPAALCRTACHLGRRLSRATG